MTKKDIEAALISTLQEIQQVSGLECPPLTKNTTPLADLPQFDSKVWPIAVCLIGEKLGIDLPNDVNIFKKEDSCDSLDISEIVNKVLSLVENSIPIETKKVYLQ